MMPSSAGLAVTFSSGKFRTNELLRLSLGAATFGAASWASEDWIRRNVAGNGC